MAVNQKSGPQPSDRSRLLEAARYHARTARRIADSAIAGNPMMDAVTHAGTAIEMMGKVLLAGTSPLLLHQPNPQVLLAAVSPDHPCEKLNRSIDAGATLELVSRVHPTLKDLRAETRTALKARNAYIHMAIPDSDPISHVDAMERFVAAGMSIIKVDSADLFSTSRMHEIQADMRARLEQLQVNAEQRVREARDSYFHIVTGLEADRIRDIDSALISRPHARTSYGGWTVECPACEYDDAWLSEEPEWDSDGDGIFADSMTVVGLDCPRCGLSLDLSDLDAIGFDTDDPREPEWEE